MVVGLLPVTIIASGGMMTRFTADEYDMMVESVWRMLGNTGLEPVIMPADILTVSPKRHEWVISVIDILDERTRLGHDLPILMRDVSQYAHVNTLSRLIAYITACARGIRFEPSWHMEKRGDTRRLPDEAWSWLRDVYSDRVAPKHFADETPDIRQARRQYRGYATMLDKAYSESRRRQSEENAELDVFGTPFAYDERQRPSRRHAHTIDGM